MSMAPLTLHRPRVSRRGIDISEQGRTAPVVNAPLPGCRRLLVAGQRKDKHFLRFVAVAATCICCLRLREWNDFIVEAIVPLDNL